MLSQKKAGSKSRMRGARWPRLRLLFVVGGLAVVIGGVWLVTVGLHSKGKPGAQRLSGVERKGERIAVSNDSDAKRVDALALTADRVTDKTAAASALFYEALNDALKRRGQTVETVCDLNDAVSRRVLEDYGAMFVASETVLPPPVCVFKSEAEVGAFQKRAGVAAAVIGGARIELQPAAMEALQAARAEAHAAGLDITPRGGTEAARRDYADTVRLWNTRFLPALTHWSKLGRLSKEQVAHLRSLPLYEQVEAVLELEQSGIYFSKDFSKSILYSIAAPGTSQHIAMLALDVEQFGNARVRLILARHGWFQTVKSDLPHFTYLGLEEKDLPARGLTSVMSGEQLFWIPNIDQKQNSESDSQQTADKLQNAD